MTTITQKTRQKTRQKTSSSALRFIGHYVEMVIAMVVGEMLFAGVWTTGSVLLGEPGFLTRPDVDSLVMATNMSLGMAIWMRVRGHAWPGIAEMSAAMYVPFLVLFPALWTGALSASDFMMWGHMLMMGAMLLVMLRRRTEYAGSHHEHDHGRAKAVATAAPETTPASRGRRVMAELKHRWPTGLALLMTIDLWVQPAVPPAWTLLVLPGAYLLIGAVRRTLTGSRDVAIQLGGLLGYLALAAAAMSVDPDLTPYLVAAGWLLHAVWDVVHHRTGKVVPRGYAEWCTVFDVAIGATILLAVAW
ncbi:DUF6010 family protein [Actinomadura rudentiformis]|uniref:DUF6010 family protein n=1 Tax=Actinomadura rudentiformis TaxID=359158 RepID=UPI00178C5C15|nr:DUF6010 family protein [Actinomadura rudentiformis]